MRGHLLVMRSGPEALNAVRSQEGKTGGQVATEIWDAPLTGGNARRVLSMQVAGEQARANGWSLVDGRSARAVPQTPRKT